MSKWPHFMFQLQGQSTQLLPNLSLWAREYKVFGFGKNCGITGTSMQIPNFRLSWHFPILQQAQAWTKLPVSPIQLPLCWGWVFCHWRYSAPCHAPQGWSQGWYAWWVYFQPQICQIQSPRSRKCHMDADCKTSLTHIMDDFLATLCYLAYVWLLRSWTKKKKKTRYHYFGLNDC